MGEYRIEELVHKAGTTVRTVQSYRQKGLLQPPEKRGRVAIYSDLHLKRLSLIADLIGRGYSLNAISELFAGLDSGAQIEDLLGVGRVVNGGGDHDAEVISRQEVTQRFGGNELAVGALIELGLIAPVEVDEENLQGSDATEFRVLLPNNLRSGSLMIKAGIPPHVVATEGVRLQAIANEIARGFVQLVAEHSLQQGSQSEESDETSLIELVRGLSQVAPDAIAEYVHKAIYEQVQTEVDRQLSEFFETED